MIKKDKLTEEDHQRILSCIPWAASIAKKFYTSHSLVRRCGYEEIELAALEGLCEAARRYDPTKGFRFITYSYSWIIASIQDRTAVGGVVTVPSVLRNNSSIRNPKTKEQAQVATRPVVYQGHTPNKKTCWTHLLSTKGDTSYEVRDEVREALKKVPKDYREVIEMTMEGMTFEEIGIEKGYTWQRANQKYRKGLRTMKKFLEKQRSIKNNGV
jgi:RNA polymerase sigma factor (sigma-70 family)